MPLDSLGKGPWQRDGNGRLLQLPEQLSIFQHVTVCAKTLFPRELPCFSVPPLLAVHTRITCQEMDENPKQLWGGRELGQLCTS